MLRAFDLAEASCPFERCPRKAGIAIAARIPMIRMTTSNSIRVKPCSCRARFTNWFIGSPLPNEMRRAVGPPHLVRIARWRSSGYQVPPVRQEPEPAVVHERVIVPFVPLVMVKKLPDLECPTI